MLQYVIKRILKMVPVLIIISIITFGIISMAPGDFVDGKANPNMSAEKIEQLRSIYGLDKSRPERYLNWAKNAVKGELGDSLRYKQPVTTVIKSYVWNSFVLAAISFALSLLIAVPIGIISATKQYSMFDKTFTLVAFITLSLPSFFVGLLSIKFFALNLGLFPIGGMTTAGSKATGMSNVADIMIHMFLPVVTLTIVQIGTFIRYIRTSMLEVIRQDYIRTARAKGLKEKVVIYKHALRNGLIPIVTYIGMSIPGLFAGAIITETIFVWPGIGNIGYQAILNRDYTLLMGFNMFIALLTLLGNLLSDILYAVVDPRIKY